MATPSTAPSTARELLREFLIEEYGDSNAAPSRKGVRPDNEYRPCTAAISLSTIFGSRGEYVLCVDGIVYVQPSGWVKIGPLHDPETFDNLKSFIDNIVGRHALNDQM